MPGTDGTERAGTRKLLGTFAAMLLAGGCTAPTRIPYRTDRYLLEVRLEPAEHRLVGRAAMDVVRRRRSQPPAARAAALELRLHPDLRIRKVRVSGARFRRLVSVPTPVTDANQPPSTTHRIVLAAPAEAMTVFVDYDGRLVQDVAAGEVPGKIHNFKMRAHVGQDGIYLADGYWYPQTFPEPDDRPELVDFTLLAHPVAGMALKAGAAIDRVRSDQTGLSAWRTPYPIESMVLVGGNHEVHRQQRGNTPLYLHLKRGQAVHVAGLFAALNRYLDRYEPLLGPYPGGELAVVDNFFSSGFAFPTFMLLASAVIDMGERSQTAHGYLDHELLHGWWGNGVFVDPRDGNWCEALASYAANYYGYVLDGDEAEARRKRRNYCHFLSRTTPADDKPLGTFGLDGGCGRDIAYHKGAMVFHMLARKMGQERFWAAMHDLTNAYVGRYASWDDLRRICEEQAGRSLEVFFRQWVRSGGAPLLRIEQARYDSAEGTLTLDISQGEPAFDLDVPIRLSNGEQTQELEVPLRSATQTVTLPVAIVPQSVELDPDYHLFRRLPAEEILPTTASTRHGRAFVAVMPGDASPEAYQAIRSVFEKSLDGGAARSFAPEQLPQGVLAESCVLILGDAVRHPYVAAFLSAIEFPVRWREDGFEFNDVRYTEASHAVLCTARHPGVAAGGVTVVYANSEAALPAAHVLPMYEHSLVVFKDRRPILREDFELPQRISVEPF